MTTNTLQLGDLPVRTISASVRPFIPDIQRQLDRGVAMVTIVAALNERGIAITASNLAKVLYRARKSQKPAPLEPVRAAAVSQPGPPLLCGGGIPAPTATQQTVSAPPLPSTSDEPKENSTISDRGPPPGIAPEQWARMSITQQSRARADEFLRKHPGNRSIVGRRAREAARTQAAVDHANPVGQLSPAPPENS